MDSFFTTRKQAEDRAISLCKLKPEGMQVLSVFDRIHEGYLGISIGMAVSKDMENIYYPLKAGEVGKASSLLRQVIAQDRLSVVMFIDDHPGALVHRDQIYNRLVLADAEAGVYLDASALIIGNSPSLQYASAGMLDNNTRADRELFKILAKEVYGVEAAPIPQAPAIVLESVEVKPDKELLIHDRLDFVKFFDDIFSGPDSEVVTVQYPSSNICPDTCLVSKNVYALVRYNLIMQSAVVRLALAELQSDKPITRFIKARKDI